MSEHCKFYEICPAKFSFNSLCSCSDEDMGSTECIPLLLEAYYDIDYKADKITHKGVGDLLHRIYGPERFENLALPESEEERIIFNGVNIVAVVNFCKSVWPGVIWSDCDIEKAIIWPNNNCRLYLYNGTTLVKKGNQIRLEDNIG